MELARLVPQQLTIAKAGKRPRQAVRSTDLFWAVGKLWKNSLFRNLLSKSEKLEAEKTTAKFRRKVETFKHP